MEAGLGERALEGGAGPKTLRRWSRSGMVSCVRRVRGRWVGGGWYRRCYDTHFSVCRRGHFVAVEELGRKGNLRTGPFGSRFPVRIVYLLLYRYARATAVQNYEVMADTPPSVDQGGEPLPPFTSPTTDNNCEAQCTPATAVERANRSSTCYSYCYLLPLFSDVSLSQFQTGELFLLSQAPKLCRTLSSRYADGKREGSVSRIFAKRRTCSREPIFSEAPRCSYSKYLPVAAQTTIGAPWVESNLKVPRPPPLHDYLLRRLFDPARDVNSTPPPQRAVLPWLGALSHCSPCSFSQQPLQLVTRLASSTSFAQPLWLLHHQAPTGIMTEQGST